MADIEKQEPIRSEYADGTIIISNVRSNIDNSTISYSVVNTWYDGTPMDDSKVDQWGVYSKYKETGEYVRENKPQWSELFLEVDTVEDLRDLEPYHEHLIKIGYYKGVVVNGYWSKGDKPALKYYQTLDAMQDDGGYSINSDNLHFIADFGGEVDVRHFGARDMIEFDSSPYIQAALDYCYYSGMTVVIPAGKFTCTRALYVSKGTHISGKERVKSILRTPFRTRARNYPVGSEDRAKAVIAEANVEASKGSYSSITSGFARTLDLVNGHNRFFLGDGIVGYFDSDRHTNPSHPLYYPDPGLGNSGRQAWSDWYTDLQRIQSRGDWVGLTGRENYARGLVKSTDNPQAIHTTNNASPEYIRERAGSRIHCGTRNIIIANLQVTTNSVDRGRDSGINFMYDASLLRGNNAGYDSSCLGIKIDNCWLYDIGGDGFSITRAVNTAIDNTIAQRVAGSGFRIQGVTSVHISSCYANGCLDNGYNIRGTHYSSMTACAADSCSRAYNFYNCTTITLNGCGAEASKAIYDDNLMTTDGDSAYPIYPGRAYSFRNCSAITVLNPYASTTREQVGSIELDESGNLPNTTRHIRIDSCSDVTVIAPEFRSYRRWRTAPFRNEANEQVTSEGRYWEFQDRLVRALFEIRGDNNSISLQTNSKGEDLVSGNQDRTPNMDVLDPGTVANPDGHTTAGRTMSGDDGNGGWLDGDGDPITADRIEILYPMKNRGSGSWNKYWNWRKSLILVRKRNDESLSEDSLIRDGEAGYLDIIGSSVNWSSVSQSEMDRFSLDEVRDRDRAGWIDGGRDFWTYAPLSLSNTAPEDEEDPETTGATLFPMPIMGAVDARTRTFEDGNRIVYNASRTDLNSIARAAHGFLGNIRDDGNMNPIIALQALISRANMLEDTLGAFPIFTIQDSLGYPLFNIYHEEKGIIGRAAGGDNRRMLSFNAADRARITKLNSATATLVQCANRINNIVDRLRAHGLILDGDA